MSNYTEDIIEVGSEAANLSKDFENDDTLVGDKFVSSESFLNTPSDVTTTEATSGSSIEDVPSLGQCKKL